MVNYVPKPLPNYVPRKKRGPGVSSTKTRGLMSSSSQQNTGFDGSGGDSDQTGTTAVASSSGDEVTSKFCIGYGGPGKEHPDPKDILITDWTRWVKADNYYPIGYCKPCFAERTNKSATSLKRAGDSRSQVAHKTQCEQCQGGPITN